MFNECKSSQIATLATIVRHLYEDRPELFADEIAADVAKLVPGTPPSELRSLVVELLHVIFASTETTDEDVERAVKSGIINDPFVIVENLKRFIAYGEPVEFPSDFFAVPIEIRRSRTSWAGTARLDDDIPF